MATILCVDDEAAMRNALCVILGRVGHESVAAASAPEALRELSRRTIDLVISDFTMPGIDGIEMMGMIAADGHDVPVIMLTGNASVDHAVLAMKAGATDYLAKPFERQHLEIAVENALSVARLRRENQALRQELGGVRASRSIIGKSVVLRRALQTVSMAARTRATVLLQGESGTGKELFARAIHGQSDRSGEAFVTMNCAALPEGLIESALFGHEKGAFTGAVRRVEGAFERAHRGTLLLDEISEMRIDLQARLLRVLQEQEFERVGGTHPVKVDVRIVATTNRNLAAAVEAGEFRQDLYYRLSVVPITVPPLRDRTEDIPLLANWFAQRAAIETGKKVAGLTPDALALLQGQHWPGNVRELQHSVERAVILSHDEWIGPHAFETESGMRSRGERAVNPASQPQSASRVGVVLQTLDIEEAERLLIGRALEVAGGNRTRAAELLGMSVRSLRSKLNGRQGTPESRQGD
jgi:DNA-binding NtrC family response regulator